MIQSVFTIETPLKFDKFRVVTGTLRRKDDKVSNIKDEIILRGLKENNLKNVDLNIPKEKIIVFTGLSGSGKSSVVFDTLAIESRRQMTLNYPQYVRYQMPRYERPHAKLMQNLSPVVMVEQRPARGIWSP